MQDPGRDAPPLAPAEQGDGADVDQFPDRHHAAHGDRDQRAEREALARQRRLQPPGEGGVADAEPGRGDERDQRREVADRLRRADQEDVVEGDVGDRAGDAVDAEGDHDPVQRVEDDQRDHPAQRHHRRQRLAAEGFQRLVGERAEDARVQDHDRRRDQQQHRPAQRLPLQVGVVDDEVGGDDDRRRRRDRLFVDDAGDRESGAAPRPARRAAPAPARRGRCRARSAPAAAGPRRPGRGRTRSGGRGSAG